MNLDRSKLPPNVVVARHDVWEYGSYLNGFADKKLAGFQDMIITETELTREQRQYLRECGFVQGWHSEDRWLGPVETL